MGKPTKLTPEIQDLIIQALQAGNYIETAVAYANIHKDTYYTWMQRGRDEPGSIYADFADAVEKARAGAELFNVGLIQKAARDGTWQAAAWFLERSHPTKWGRWNRVEVSGPDGEPIKVQTDIRSLVAEKFRAAEIAAQVIDVGEADDPPALSIAT